MYSILIACLLTDLPDLKALPDVESVKVAVQCDNPSLTIIHLRDWHFLDYDTFKADIAGQVPDEQFPREFTAFAKEVELIQDEQEKVLRALVKAGYRDVWIEGLTPPLESIFPLICRASARNGLFDSPNPLHVGAVGRLSTLGIVKAHALDTDEGLEAANPIDDQGSLREVSDADYAKRENLMVRELKDRKGVAIVVLGGAHDLSDNVPARVKLVTVTVKGYAKASGEADALK